VAQNVLTEIQRRLDFMQKNLKKDLNTAELKVANLAIEEELEESIPSSFRKAYEETESWDEAAKLISKNILTNVNKFIGEAVKNDMRTGKLDKNSRLAKVIDIVDAESWTGSVSKSEAGDIYKAVVESKPTAPNVHLVPTEDAVIAFMDHYSAPSLLEQGARAIAARNRKRR